MSLTTDVGLLSGHQSLELELSTILSDKLSEDEEVCVAALAYNLFGVLPQQPFERIHRKCFPQEQPFYIFRRPLYQIYCWLCTLTPTRDATLSTSMTGAFTLF